ncbi:type II toxin-antitoxin system RelE family toxin [Archaeoglobus neptunius]|uniref:type II toxin-antitoxin system RelE family toxin n=1 Tax=Archaeoglobus neptunius TaxID=2798580 RepID=UPI001929655E|nr:type II toxin-antitoxin system RelE/ParE family toxin [Archaeoglobus neptunius]
MEWRIVYHKNAKKFLRDLDENRRNTVFNKLNELVDGLQDGVIPIRRLDIQKLKGKWEGFVRLRVGNFRVILRIDLTRKTVFVYNIHFRGKVY